MSVFVVNNFLNSATLRPIQPLCSLVVTLFQNSLYTASKQSEY